MRTFWVIVYVCMVGFEVEKARRSDLLLNLVVTWKQNKSLYPSQLTSLYRWKHVQGDTR